MKLFTVLLALLGLTSGALFAEHLSADQVRKILEENKNVVFLDVRQPKEIEEMGSVKGYVNIPLDQLEKRLSEIPKNKYVITACSHGVRAGKAENILKSHGYKTLGSCGLQEWKDKGYKLEK